MIKVNKVFLETSIFIRYFTGDDKKKLTDCLSLLEMIEKGRLRPYTSSIVVLEIIFVLTRIYKFSKKEVLEGIEKILRMRNLTIIETTDILKALTFYKKHNIKLGDCIIATQVPKGVKLVSYDEDFAKINSLTVLEPKKLI